MADSEKINGVNYPTMGAFTFSHSGTYADTDRIVGKASTLKQQFDSRGDELRTALNALINRINNHAGDGTGLVSIADLNAVLSDIQLPEGQGSGLMAQNVYDGHSVHSDAFKPVDGYTELEDTRDEETGVYTNHPACGMMRLTDKQKLDKIKLPTDDSGEEVSGDVSIPALTNTVSATDSTKAVTGKAVADYIGSGNLFKQIWSVTTGTIDMEPPTNPFQLSPSTTKYSSFDLLLATFTISSADTSSPIASVVFIPGTTARVTAEYNKIVYGRSIITAAADDGDTVTFSNCGMNGQADGKNYKKFLVPLALYGIKIGASVNA